MISLETPPKFITWLETIGLFEYAGMFAENGYDDLQLLEGMEEIEVKHMIEVLGIKKQGHVLKLKKCIGQLALQMQTKANFSTKRVEPGAATPLKKQSSEHDSYLDQFIYAYILAKNNFYSYLASQFDLV